MTKQKCTSKGVKTDIENLLDEIGLQELVYHDVSTSQQLESIMERWPLLKELASHAADSTPKGSGHE